MAARKETAREAAAVIRRPPRAWPAWEEAAGTRGGLGAPAAHAVRVAGTRHSLVMSPPLAAQSVPLLRLRRLQKRR
jgi:hypothetical protein